MTRIAVIDLETTGFSPSNDRIIEVGICFLKNWKLDGVHGCLVNPEMLIPKHITELTGIKQYDVDEESGAKTFREMMHILLFLLGDCKIAAYNANFDRSFLISELTRAGVKEIPENITGEWIDPLKECRTHLDLPKYRLPYVLNHLNINPIRSHRAKNDASSTAILMRRLHEDFGCYKEYTQAKG